MQVKENRKLCRSQKSHVFGGSKKYANVVKKQSDQGSSPSNHSLKKSLTKRFKVRKGREDMFLNTESQLDFLKIKSFCASRTHLNYTIKKKLN